MKNHILVILLFIASHSVAQTESYQIALEDFKTHFNNSDAQAIFDMMNGTMQEQLGFDNVQNIVTSFRRNLGEISDFKFLSSEGITEIYETTFENGKQNISFSLNDKNLLNGLRFYPAQEEDVVAKMERNQSRLSLPFKGEWFTVWGGDTKAQNYHVVSKTQKNAFDFLVLGPNRKTFERSGTRNEDYFAFGKPIYAVCDAEVFRVITGVEDNKPGEMNPAQMLGNSVILKTEYDEYIVYAHFEKETIKVKEGQSVKRGQYLGNCGNSGNSTEAHLHLHIQDGPNFMGAVGVKCYFDEILVNGEKEKDYSPVRLDKIAPIEE
ncbi:peptidoglycan DD-metalloendopeptidase family protein [Constantimarinum furrinae]|uniref:Peptidase M23 n=1 Tax=Constantimarinum furrinae TaxID=2562285 RepID=A0A7G8PXZ4_9FLAO|nr:peptidoglycan DD-metalloendopeptidase family protein [Constantimarinum furrinae]QNJ99210.1 peptidase M23 [Constantimarinum furrinae]